MTDEAATTPPPATATDLAALAEQQFILLTTFRRSGVAVPTTIWFANDGDRLFFQTGPESGKVKRIRANGQVTIAPSTRTGDLLGPAVSARARLLSGAEAEAAEAALQAKYGEARTRLMAQMGHAGRTMDRAYLAIEALS
jgi:PPOX class probable F420-dependent enzyme